jgi:hypothetical protein
MMFMIYIRVSDIATKTSSDDQPRQSIMIADASDTQQLLLNKQSIIEKPNFAVWNRDSLNQQLEHQIAKQHFEADPIIGAEAPHHNTRLTTTPWLHKNRSPVLPGLAWVTWDVAW